MRKIIRATLPTRMLQLEYLGYPNGNSFTWTYNHDPKPDDLLRCHGVVSELYSKSEKMTEKGWDRIPNQDIESSGVILWEDQIYKAAIAGHEVFDAPPETDPTGLFSRWQMMLYMCPEDETFKTPEILRIDPLTGVWSRILLYIDHRSGEGRFERTDFDEREFLKERAEDGDSAKGVRMIKMLYAQVALLQQEFVFADGVSASRPERRRAQKARRELPDIKIVHLRRPEPRHPEGAGQNPQRDQDAESREYSCQWLVGAHWRRPNVHMKVQRPIYVSGYLKGPADKPFRAPRPTIFKADR